VSDYLNLDITPKCSAFGVEERRACRRYRPKSTEDYCNCAYFERNATTHVCGFYKQYVGDVKDYLERVLKAHKDWKTEYEEVSDMLKRAFGKV